MKIRGHRFGSRSGWRAALMLLAGLCGAGCNTYSYFDVHVKLDDAGFSRTRRAVIHTCHLFLTGAVTTDTILARCSPPDSNDVGTFNYSTFTDSGSVMFTLRTFEGTGEVNKIGEGSTSLAISSGNTVAGELTVLYTGPADQL